VKRGLICMLLLLALGPAALPSVAVGADTPGTIEGTITKAEDGTPFVLPGPKMLTAEAFSTASGERVAAVWIAENDGVYEISGLPAGSYKVRFRLLTVDGEGIARYRWYGNKATYAAATTVVLSPGETEKVDFGLPRLKGATLSGTVGGDGNPASSECVFVDVFEAGGVSLGMVVVPSSADGTWTLSKVPAGAMTAVAAYYDEPAYGCPTYPSWLFQWYGPGGASGGWDDYATGAATLRADPRLLATAATFTVPMSGTLPDIDFVLIPTPACAGRGPTQIGTSLADTIDGTAGSDVILGLGGADIIHGKGKGDKVCGGNEGDTLYGDGGNDRLEGGAGNDTLVGGLGTDTAVGGAGNDTCDADTEKTCELDLP
jgi:Ca2+-binding RTX toxin-like protein